MGKAVQIALAIALLVSGAIAEVAGGIESRTGTRASRGARRSPSGPPNVLMFVTDDQRQDAIATLPSVKKWFGEQGTEFTDAYATTPLCCPSRASILTGRYPHNHHVYENGLDAVERLHFGQLLPAYLKRAGYRTALLGKYFNDWPVRLRPPHFDRWAVTNFEYYNARFNIQGRESVVKRYSTDYLADRAVDYIADRARRTSPWFLYVAPLASHSPYQPEEAYAGAAVPRRPQDASVGEEDRSDKPPWVSSKRGARPRRVQTVYEQQLRTLMSVDDMVDDVMTALDRSGQADNTIAIFMSDNGFLWGEHRLGNKRQPYLPSIHIPMFLRWPGHVAAGVTDRRLAANIDVLPTILDAVGIEARGELDGLSLLSRKRREALFLEYRSGFKEKGKLPSWAAVLTPAHHYIHYYGPMDGLIYREYYDLARDPAQLLNLLGDEDASNDPPQALQRTLATLIERGRSCKGTSCNELTPLHR